MFFKTYKSSSLYNHSSSFLSCVVCHVCRRSVHFISTKFESINPYGLFKQLYGDEEFLSHTHLFLLKFSLREFLL